MPRIVLCNVAKKCQYLTITLRHHTGIPATTTARSITVRVGRQLGDLYPSPLPRMVQPGAPVSPESQVMSVPCAPGSGPPDDQEASIGHKSVARAKYVAVRGGD